MCGKMEGKEIQGWNKADYAINCFEITTNKNLIWRWISNFTIKIVLYLS